MADKARIDVDVVVSNQKRIAQLEKSLGRTTKATIGLGSAAKIAATAFAAIGFSRLIGNVVSSIRQFQDLRQTLITIEGDAIKAAKSFDLIKEFTAGTTFQLGEVTNAFITFKNAGLDPTAEFMTNIGNIAAGMGRRIDDVSQAVFNATTGEFEMLKQLGIKVKTEGDRLTVNFRGTAFNIKNDGKEIIDFLNEIGRVKFAGAIERQSQTLTGAISNLQDEFAIAANEIGEGGLTDALTTITKDIISLTKENKDLAHALGKTLGDALLFVRNNFELLTKVLAALAIGSVIASFGRLATGIAAVTTATKLLTAAARANPYIAAATVIAIGLGILADKLGLFSDANADATESVNSNSKALFTNNDAYTKATGTIAANTAATAENTIGKFKSAEATNTQTDAQKRLLATMKKQFQQVLLLNESEIEANDRKEREQIKNMDAALKEGAITFEEYEKARTEIAIKHANIRDRIETRNETKRRQDFKSAIENIKQGKIEELDFEKMTTQQKVEVAAAGLGSMLSNAATFNKKAFELNKKAQIAMAIVNTAVGVTNALKAYPPPFSFIMAAAQLAAGVAQVNAIKSTQFPGRKFGGQVMAGRTYTVGENGPETFRPSSTGMIAPNSQSGGQTEVNVNFNITATDAQSFDELLVQRRDTIVGVINEALNENGQRSLV